MRCATQFILAIICCHLLAITFVHADEIAGKCETIVYSANPQYPPYHWAVGGGRLEGASIELLDKLRLAGVMLKPVVYPWKRVLLMAEHGEIDLVLSLRKTPERSAFLTFTDGQSFPNPIVVFVRADRSFPYQQWADLKGRRGLISLGDKFGGGFDEYWPKDLVIQESGTMDENFKRLKEGQIDYFITSQFAGQAHLNSPQGRAGRPITYLAPPISDEGVYFGFSKKSPCISLLTQFDRRLSALKKQHELGAILNKYLNESRAVR
jgi:polar amino acid transport system substrate-binding protein